MSIPRLSAGLNAGPAVALPKVRARSLMVAALLTGTLALAGCGTATEAPAPGSPGGSDAPVSGGPPSTSPSAPSKPKVDRLVFTIASPTRTTLEVRHLSEPHSFVTDPMYDFLLGIEPTTGKLRPGVATKWTVEPDGKSFRVQLRKGLMFHKGYGELTASDVRWGWERLQLEDSLHGQGRYWRTKVKDVEIVNDHEVIFRMVEPNGQFLIALSEQQGGIEVRSRKHFDEKGISWETGALAGTGPYEFSEGKEEQYIRYKRSDATKDHFRGVPDFPEFEYRFAKEASTRIASLLTGEVQMAVLPEDLLEQAKPKGFTAIGGQFPGTRVFGRLFGRLVADMKDLDNKGWHHPASPMLDIRVRQALNKAVNKDELNTAFFGGKGEIMYTNHHHPSRLGYNKDWEKNYKDMYGYDPAKAKALLAEAGYNESNPLETTIEIAALSGGIANPGDLSEAIAGYFQKVGVEVTLSQLDPAKLSALGRTLELPNNIQMSASGSNLWTGYGIYNSTSLVRVGAEDHEMEKLLQKVTTTLQPEDQDAIWRAIGDVNYNQFLNLNGLWLPVEVTVDPKIVGSWEFPGNITGAWTHIENIKAAK